MKKVTLIFAAAFVMLFASNAQAQLGFNFGYAPQTTTVSLKSTSSHSDMTGLFAGILFVTDQCATGRANYALWAMICLMNASIILYNGI